ncbi:MAG TPA: DUF3376 domain-containing protein [Thermoanaerobaculia bacterium]
MHSGQHASDHWPGGGRRTNCPGRIVIGHFGAFFNRDGRERDYVWGRLDGAERVLALLRGKQDNLSENPRLQPLFHAILGEEEADRVVKPAKEHQQAHPWFLALRFCRRDHLLRLRLPRHLRVQPDHRQPDRHGRRRS